MQVRDARPSPLRRLSPNIVFAHEVLRWGHVILLACAGQGSRGAGFYRLRRYLAPCRRDRINLALVHSNPGRAACAFAVAGGTPAFPETRTMTRRGVLDPTRTDRSVRSVAILDTNSGENVDALLLVYPNDDASVVARCRAMKGLILALRGATRSLSGRDATCATRCLA